MSDLAPPNSMTVLGREVLLVEVGGGAQVHLAMESVDDEARSAVDPWYLDPTRPGFQQSVSGYDAHGLLVRRWDSRTLCGRAWDLMAAGDAGQIVRSREPVSAPTCRSCLRRLDADFPTVSAPPGVGVLASVVADEVVEWGSVAVRGIPGEHLETTRRAIRNALKKRGLRSSTYVVDDVVHVISQDAVDAIPEETRRAWINQAFAGMGGDPKDALAGPIRSGVIDWHTWAGS